MPVVVEKHRCPQNHPCPCVRICPTGAVTQNGFNAPNIDEEACIQCGECVRICPYRAINDLSYQGKASRFL